MTQQDAAAARRASEDATVNHSTLDRDVLVEVRLASPEGSPDLAGILIDEFIAEATAHVGTLRDAAQRHDIRIMRAIAHSLKGSSSTMGARRLAALCAQLEASLERDPDAVVAPIVASIDEELIRVCDALAEARL